MSDDCRVMVALSGGVDSAVAALLLADRGYEVDTITLLLREDQNGGAVPSPEAIHRARAVSDQLGVEYRLIDARDAFRTEVVDYFIAEYTAGRTPNPCVPCNRFVRFGFLLDYALALGDAHLATGHYARIQRVDGRCQLLRGRDSTKDQSYFLYRLTQEQLAHAMFPVGDLTKEAVRGIAARHNLPVKGQAESQDICFLADGDYRSFLAEHAPHALEPGTIRDTEGRLLGRHQGLAGYTIGQRKGLGISAPEPLYVLAIRPDENTLIVGTADELGRDECLVEEMHIISGEEPPDPFRAEAQIRYRARPAPVTVEPLGGRQARVRFDAAQRDITPGQSLVLYEGDVVLSGGVICETQDSVL